MIRKTDNQTLTDNFHKKTESPVTITIKIFCLDLGCFQKWYLFQITWIDGEGNVMTNNLQYTTELLQDGRRVTARSILRLTPKRKHHNQTLTCQAQNTADRAYRSATVYLEVSKAILC